MSDKILLLLSNIKCSLLPALLLTITSTSSLMVIYRPVLAVTGQITGPLTSEMYKKFTDDNDFTF